MWNIPQKLVEGGSNMRFTVLAVCVVLAGVVGVQAGTTDYASVEPSSSPVVVVPQIQEKVVYVPVMAVDCFVCGIPKTFQAGTVDWYVCDPCHVRWNSWNIRTSVGNFKRSKVGKKWIKKRNKKE